MKVLYKDGRGRETEFNIDVPEKIDDLMDRYGTEFVVGAVHKVIRNALKSAVAARVKEKKKQDAIEDELSTSWMPGLRSGASPLEKVRKLATKLGVTQEQLASLIEGDR